jgi:uncharacterized SAM-binding protein YcdF (DUF218 family)
MLQRLILGLLAAGLLWAVGLAVFITGLPHPSQTTPAKVDAVIVYTGGGGARISAGMAVFSDGAGKRLLISGVHPDTSRERLSEFWDGTPDRFDCCVDLGRMARSTRGNAEEAAQWAREHEFKGLVLVTSDYHMPRAITIAKAQMPEMDITPYVVASGYLNDNRRPNSRKAWRKLSGEYNKYLLARFMSLFSFVGR